MKVFQMMWIFGGGERGAIRGGVVRVQYLPLDIGGLVVPEGTQDEVMMREKIDLCVTYQAVSLGPSVCRVA